MRNLLVLLAILTISTTARASGDGVFAATQGTFVTGESTGLALGLGGLAFTRGSSNGFLYASVAWPSATIEAGWGARLATSGSWQAIGAVGGLLAPRGGATAGLRGVLGGAYLSEGESLWWRPGVNASLAFVTGTDPGFTVLLPVEASLDVGLKFGATRPFLHLSSGVDMVAGTRWTGRGEVALGCVFGG